MSIIEPPKTLEDFEKVLESIIELQNNPWLDGTMSDSLLEKEYQVRKKIKELKTNKNEKHFKIQIIYTSTNNRFIQSSSNYIRKMDRTLQP